MKNNCHAAVAVLIQDNRNVTPQLNWWLPKIRVPLYRHPKYDNTHYRHKEVPRIFGNPKTLNPTYTYIYIYICIPYLSSKGTPLFGKPQLAVSEQRRPQGRCDVQ